MSITVSVFDIFTYAIPGSLYLALIAYITARLDWINVGALLQGNTTIVLIALAIGSYLTGQITYAVGRSVGKRIGFRQVTIDEARAEFLRRVPAAERRPYVHAHRSVLQTAVEVRQQDAALEIIRLRAVGLMLRNSVPPFALGALVSLIEIFARGNPGLAVSCCAGFLLAAAASDWNSVRLSNWADMKTLEVAFWIPGIDQDLMENNPESSDSRITPNGADLLKPKPIGE